MTRICTRAIARLGGTFALTTLAFLSPLSAQNLKQDLPLQGTSALLPFGDGHTTKALAGALLAEEGLSYISHFACRGSDCRPGLRGSPGPETPADEITQFELTGFHPRLGAAKVVIHDIPCAAPLDAKLDQAPKLAEKRRRPGCFAGYRASMRVFYDIGFAQSDDGWHAEYGYRMEVPNHPEEDAGGPLWTPVATLTLDNEAYGWSKISDGAWKTYRVELRDADDKLLWQQENGEFTIPDSAGEGGGRDLGGLLPQLDIDRFPGPIGARINGLSDLPTSDATPTSAGGLIDAPVDGETIAFCDTVSEDMSEVLSSVPKALVNMSEILMNTISFGHSGTDVSIGAPDIIMGVEMHYDSNPGHIDTVRRSTEEGQGALAAALNLGCLASAYLLDDDSPADPDPALSPLLLSGAGEQVMVVRIDSGEDWQSNSCGSYSTEESVEVGEQVCTQTVVVSCNALCNCDHTEVITCDQEDE